MARSNETAHYTSSPARTRLAHQNRARLVFFIEEEYNGGLLMWEAHTSALRQQEDIYARHPMMFISEAIHLACYITRGGGLLRCNGSPNVNLAKQDFEVMPGPSGDAAAIRCQGRRNETSRVCWAHLEGRRTTHQRPVINIEAPLTHREEFRSSHGALVLLRQPRSGILRSPRTLCSEFQSLLLFFFSITHLPNTPGLILRCIRLPITC